MKRIALICLVIPLIFNTGITATEYPCNCPDDRDTIGPGDTIRKIVQLEAARVDSFVLSKKVIADSLRMMADSLAVEVKLMERDSKKKRVLGRTDQWREADGRVHIWRWYYHKYKDGELRYDTTIKRSYYGIL